MSEAESLDFKNILTRNISNNNESKDVNGINNKLLVSETTMFIKQKIKEKYAMIKNKMIVTSILLSLPFILNIIAVALSNWVIYKDFHFALLYIYDSKIDENITYSDFISNNCIDSNMPNELKNHEFKKQCASYDVIRIVGIVIFILYILGVLFNIFSEIILILMIGWPDLFQALKSKTGWRMKLFSIISLIHYFIATLTFLLAILIVRTEDEVIGLAFYIALVSCLIYFCVFLYYWKVKRKLKRNRVLSKLLNPDNLLLKSDFGIVINKN